MKVIIAEKPDVARNIARVLNVTEKKEGYISNSEYYVTWCIGHLVGLAEPTDYGYSKQWIKSELPMLPSEFKLNVSEKVEKQYNVVKSLFDKASEIIVATDAGREGELIFRYVYTKADCKKPFKRLWISSLTDEAISEGFKNLKDGRDYDPLYFSAKARSEADWLLGLNATRALTLANPNANVLSLGRVQTPVLAMVCQRYLDNTNFVAKDFFVPQLKLTKNSIVFKANYNDSFEKIEDAQSVISGLGSSINCFSADEKEKKEKQPLPYDLTSLQRDANQKFKFSAQQTLDIAQSLYETHKVLTYPRTESSYLSEDIYPTLPSLFEKLKNGNFSKLVDENVLSPLPKNCIDNSQVTDHHAIIPTGKTSSLNTDEAKIYNLVCQRFIASFSGICVKSITTYTFGNEGKFVAKGTVVKSIGWRNVYANDNEEKEEKEDNENPSLPLILKSEDVSIQSKEVDKRKTKPLAIHTESSLLGAMLTAGKNIEDEELAKEMKEQGIGTPATRASIIETLVTREYISKEKNKLIPLEKGLKVYELVKNYDFSKPELTGQWESKLNKIAKRNYDYSNFISEIKSYTTQVVSDLINSEIKIVNNEKVCPSCKKGQIITGKKGFGCNRWNDENDPCNFVIWNEIAGVKIGETVVNDLIKNGVSKLIKGFKNKEEKTFDAMLFVNNGKVEFKFPEAMAETDLIICPKCKVGKIKESKLAFSCDKYTEGCKFSIWKNGSNISYKDIKDLLNGKPTKVFKFVSKDNKSYSANLTFDKTKIEVITNKSK